MRNKCFVAVRWRKYMLAWIGTVGVAISCGGNPTAPTNTTINVSGTWDAEFVGTIQGQGTRQADSFVLDLQQSGPSVTGTIRVVGLDGGIPLRGEVRGNSFTYDASVTLAPGCEARVRADATVERSGSRFSGRQTQATCEGTAVGTVTATRR